MCRRPQTYRLAIPTGNVQLRGRWRKEVVAQSDFIKGKRRKKAADKPVLVVKPGEVVVSRRLYRSGQSEYLINGRVARLRDIQEMFMGVGLGPDSYAIIEQGRIGLILSTKPMERRAIIEEAAGVTKFKTKKRLAEAKLESSKVNLSRGERHCGGGGEAAGIAEAAGGEGAEVFGDSRPDARDCAADVGGEGAGVGW